MADPSTPPADLSPEDRLRRISYLWETAISRGHTFLSDQALVPVLRDLLDGFDPPLHWLFPDDFDPEGNPIP